MDHRFLRNLGLERVNGPIPRFPNDNTLVHDNNIGNKNKLFVGGLRWDTTPDKLGRYFSQFGIVTDVHVLKDTKTKKSRGFGFVTFRDAIAVRMVLGISIHVLDGNRIDPRLAEPKSSTVSKTNRIFVGGVSQETSAEDVKAYFSQFGRVLEAAIIMDPRTGRHRGFGFVTFESADVAKKICEIHFHSIKKKKVECKFHYSQTRCNNNTVTPLGSLATGAYVPINPIPPNMQYYTAPVHQPTQWNAAQTNNCYNMIGGGDLNYPSLGNYRYSPYPHLQNLVTLFLNKP